MELRKTKIICTVGPAIDSEEMLIKMFDAGMNVARLNFSHATYDESIRRIENIRNACKKTNKHIGIMLDTKGPEIRVGTFEGGKCSYEKGDSVELVSEEVIGNKERFYVNCVEFFSDISVNDEILIDDGKISLTVISKEVGKVICKFNNSGIIKNKKGINVPGVPLTMPFVSEKDLADIKFGCRYNVDLIALSFVRRAEDVLEVRKILNNLGRKNVEIISKIENQDSINNLEEIMDVSDGIMVARGDLGVEVAPELVPIYQKKITKMANQKGKPVIIATHMMESMIHSPRPTRAEASDVANAILDGCDAIMLSGESAVGEYPIESVKYMNKIALTTEAMIDYVEIHEENSKHNLHTKSDAISSCVSQCCLTLDNISAVFAFTETGGTAKRISKFRPSVPVIACTDKESTCRRLSYYFGVYPVISNYVNDISMCDDITNEVARGLEIAEGSQIIIVSGFGQKHGVTNTIRIIEVE